MAYTKLNNKVIETASKYVALGTPVKYICDSLLISEVTWYSWYNKGMEANDKETNDNETLETKFFKSVKKAKGDLIARNLQVIEKAAQNGTWTASAWKLERLDFENFGKKEKREHSGNIGNKQYNDMTEAELLELAKERGIKV
jgi:hypothetical protein